MQELDEAWKRETAAWERMNKAIQEHGDAVRSRAHLAEFIEALERELEFERNRRIGLLPGRSRLTTNRSAIWRTAGGAVC
jgi:hypothetical protein